MLDILNQLQSTRSRNEKEAILKGLDNDQAEAFKYVAWLAYDPTIDFYVKEFTPSETFEDCVTLKDALKDLEFIIANRLITGNKAKKWIEDTHGLLSEDNAEVFLRVVKRDLKCGVSAKTVNKLWPDTVYIHPYMRCSSFSEKNLESISFPCYSQTKMDGLYCDIMVFEDKVEYRSRNGGYLQLNDDSRDKFLLEYYPNTVLMGEALAYEEDDPSTLMNRSLSNGYLNSNFIDPDRVCFYLWDMVTLQEFEAEKSSRLYGDRFTLLETLLRDYPGQDLFEVNTVDCHNQQDILDHFKQQREEGEEGTVIKDASLEWKPGTPKKQIKCKVIFDCDLKVVGYKVGTGKFEGMLGSIACMSDDGELEVSVGSGLTDAQRKTIIPILDHHIQEGVKDLIAVVRGNDVITNQDNPDKYSIFLPRLVELRTDKDEADSLEKIQEQVKSFTDALDMIK